MKKVKFIYNPYSGEKSIINKVDKVIKVHQKHGYSIIPYRIELDNGLENAFEDINEGFEYVLVAGGDGTIDKAVNYMKHNNIDIPLAVLPVGTANDFAKLLGIPRSVEKACEQIVTSEVQEIDLGKVNDDYFINVASTGLFTDVSHKTDINLKNTMGKLAYYIKGVEEVSNLRKIPIKITSEEMNIEEDMYLLLIFNGQTAGNFKLAYNAKINDGLLDVILVKAASIPQTLTLFIQILREDHLDKGNNIIHFQTKSLEIFCDENLSTDIDGELGPAFPLKISCEHNGLKMKGIKL
ncbi:lipid kinase [Clostridium bornimense]|uniref:Lipid kinase n=1 Tax=Clostridium bornimense TaxID=1216932 RepID=W6S1F7_9CLOT|nr:YegS/Rv2252/BmrU family lipid kinase [Clostridium bornimense]CDM68127.1 lipid kinase [Clostridium bornimense]